jgi:hypothetical protein
VTALGACVARELPLRRGHAPVVARGSMASRHARAAEAVGAATTEHQRCNFFVYLRAPHCSSGAMPPHDTCHHLAGFETLSAWLQSG